MNSLIRNTLKGETAAALYERMLLIRRMEERLRDDAAAGKLPGTVHLYIGQEAVAVGVCHHLNDSDWITSTHRGHGHFLAKGGDPETMMAEIWGKSSGVCKGMGGSMHVADFSKGIMGANGIVAGGLAIACGAAWAAKLEGQGRVGVAFFGDGAANQGVFMETLNIAAIWKLPMIFVCENNLYSEFTPSSTVTAGALRDRVTAFGIPTNVIDGNDVTAVWGAAQCAIERGRNGGGPSFIEAMTYRIQGHLEGEAQVLGGGRYRNASEIETWNQKDPIRHMARRLTAEGYLTETDLVAMDERIRNVVEDACAFAESSEHADPEIISELMFTDRVLRV